MLIKLLRIYGIDSLTDYETRVFNCDLKKNESIVLPRLSAYQKSIEQLYGVEFGADTVDGAVRMLKNILHVMGIAFTSGRTSKSVYFSLSKEKPTYDNVNRLGNYAFRSSDVGNRYCPLMDLGAQLYLRSQYSIAITHFEPVVSDSDNNTFNVCVGGDYVSSVLISFKMGSMHTNVTDCIRKISAGDVEYTLSKITIDKESLTVAAIYNANCVYSFVAQVGPFVNVCFDFEKYLGFDVIDIGISGCVVYFDLSERKTGCIKNIHKDMSSSITGSLNFKTNHVALRVGSDSTDTNPLRAVNWVKSINISKKPSKIVLKYNNTMRWYLDKELIEYIHTLYGKYCVPYYDPVLGNNFATYGRIDYITLDIYFDEETDVTVDIESFDQHMSKLMNPVTNVLDKYYGGYKLITTDGMYKCTALYCIMTGSDGANSSYRRLNIPIKNVTNLTEHDIPYTLVRMEPQQDFIHVSTGSNKEVYFYM